MNKKILVTGANGQLGMTIKELFSKNDDNLDFVFVSKEDLDITNNENINQFFINNKFDYCINCAAYTNVEQAERTPEIAYKVNDAGVKHLAIACKVTNTILVQISTDYVFDGEKNTPYTPNDRPNPINEYGKSKRKGEEHIQDILKKYFIIRTSWLYSKKHGRNFYKTILEKAKSKAELSVTTDQTGCPTDAINLSNYIIDLAKGTTVNYGIKHFCGEKEMTWYDFAKQILKENNLSHKVKLVKAKNYHTFARRPKKSVLLTEKRQA